MTISTDEQTIRKIRLVLSRREVARPLLLFAGTLMGYLATIAAILVNPTAVSLALVPVAVAFVGLLFIIGHDACHQSFTASRRLNQAIGRIVFLPALTSYSLWDSEHNRRHHRSNNVRHLDKDFAPMTAEEFGAASPVRRAWYAFSRSATGVPFYYIHEIWFWRLLFPRKALLGTVRFEHYADTALICGFFAGYSAVLAIVGGWSGKGAYESIILGLAVPFFVFNLMISVAIFVHHTHYLVPWYESIEEWQQNRGSIKGTIHVKFPYMLGRLALNIMAHNAHHYAPGVPLYRLEVMQDELATPELVTWTWSMANYRTICERCKLFDFSASRWTNFAGVAATSPLLKKALPQTS